MAGIPPEAQGRLGHRIGFIEVKMVCLVDFLAFEGRFCGEKQELFYQVPISHKLNVEISHDISRRRCKM